MRAPSPRRRVGFVLERSLGHITHADNLARLLPEQPEIDAALLPIDFAVDGWAAHVPVYRSNWTVRSGWRANRAIRRLHAEGSLDALFIHTQVPSVLSQRWMGRVPTVVSLDATPMQYDELGEHYDHSPGGARVEALKYRVNRSSIHRAAHVVTWSEWARRGVIQGYGVAPERVSVIPPGVTPSLWTRPGRPADDGPVRILFVGGDLRRKGGNVLLEAFRALRVTAEPEAVELHLVTRTPLEPEPGVHVHKDLEPNSAALIALYHRAHVFCLPTRGDCLPMVLSEAGAAGLPAVSTAVAGIPEIVRDGETGLVVPVDDVAALTAALHRLVDDAPLRQRLGVNARELVLARFDAEKNVRLLVAVLLRTMGASVSPAA
jgi:glycosyltransferase involved in cell wall biosynthesis